jgi:hypothetical protein
VFCVMHCLIPWLLAHHSVHVQPCEWSYTISSSRGVQFYLTLGQIHLVRPPLKLPKSRDNSVGLALGYGLDERSSRVRFTAGTGNFFSHHLVQKVPGAHPASYPMNTRGPFSGGKAAGA